MTQRTIEPSEAVAEPQVAPLPQPSPVEEAVTASSEPRAGLWSRVSAWLHTLTIADGLMALVVGLAAIVRFTNLGLPPLSPSEAEAALASWQFTNANAAVGAVTSPAYFTLTNGAMLILGSSDTIARLIPAIAGTATVALLWLLSRSWRGAGIVTAAAFLALSPLNVFASRTAGGEAIAVFALLLLVIASIRLAADRKRRWAYTLGVALGLGLASDALFLSGLVAFAPIWFWLAHRQPAAGGEIEQLASHWRPVAIAFTVTFLLVSTSFLVYPQGLGASFRIAADWLASFGLPWSQLGANSALAPFAATLRYEPAVVVLGIPALIWSVMRRSNVGWLMAGWAALLVVLAIVQPGVLSYALLFTLPGYLLIALVARDLLPVSQGSAGIVVAVAGGLILLGMILLVSMGRYTRLAIWSSDQIAFLALALIAFVAAGGVLVLAMSYNSHAARLGAFIGLVALLLYAQWGTANQLTQRGTNDPRERIVAEGTDDDVRVLVALVRDISLQANGGETDLELISTADTPTLRWYLREYGQAQFGDTLPVQATPQAIITPAGAELRLGDDYMGADFGLRRYRSAATPPLTLNDRLLWLLFNESTLPVETERVILWVRADLAGGGR